MVRIGIIDKDVAARLAIKALITAQNQLPISVVFEWEKPIEDSPIPPVQIPHVILIDMMGYGLHCIRYIRKRFPKSDLIVMSNKYNYDTVYEAFRYGAVSYLRKDTCLKDIVYAITITLKGGSVISPCISREIVERIHQTKLREDLLTARELQIAKGIADGLSYKCIAEQYLLSLDTVRVYIKRIYRKLEINSKGELLAKLKI